jgi:hypothetical protein
MRAIIGMDEIKIYEQVRTHFKFYITLMDPFFLFLFLLYNFSSPFKNRKLFSRIQNEN